MAEFECLFFSTWETFHGMGLLITSFTFLIHFYDSMSYANTVDYMD